MNTWHRFRRSTISNQASIVFGAIVTIATVGNIAVAVIQYRTAKENAKSGSEQTQKLINAADKNAGAGESFSNSARSINAGILNAVSQLQKQAAETSSLSDTALVQAKAANALAAVAITQANIAQKSQNAMIAVQRAFIFPKVSASIARDRRYKEFLGADLLVGWRNTGTTPTKNLAVTVASGNTEPTVEDFKFEKKSQNQIIYGAGAAYVPPNGDISTAPIRIPEYELLSISDGRSRQYIWGKATYYDVFEDSKEHETRFCYQVQNVDKTFEISSQPENLDIRFQECGHDNNCYDEGCPAIPK